MQITCGQHCDYSQIHLLLPTRSIPLQDKTIFQQYQPIHSFVYESRNIGTFIICVISIITFNLYPTQDISWVTSIFWIRLVSCLYSQNKKKNEDNASWAHYFFYPYCVYSAEQCISCFNLVYFIKNSLAAVVVLFVHIPIHINAKIHRQLPQ